MPIILNTYQFSYEKKRFQEPSAPSDTSATSKFTFSEEGTRLFTKAIEAAIQSSQELSGTGKMLPLQGLVDLTTKTIYIGALTPRDAEAFVFNEEPLFEHKKPGLFESGRYSPRLVSYQTKYSKGPSAHQQLLLHAVRKDRVSADDAENKRGIAINIKVINKNVTIVIDGKSLSINETAQYLRTVHRPGYELTDHEADNSVLKAGKIYSELCEDYLFESIADACRLVISDKIISDSKKKQHDQQFFPVADTDEGYWSADIITHSWVNQRHG